MKHLQNIERGIQRLYYVAWVVLFVVTAFIGWGEISRLNKEIAETTAKVERCASQPAPAPAAETKPTNRPQSPIEKYLEQSREIREAEARGCVFYDSREISRGMVSNWLVGIAAALFGPLIFMFLFRWVYRGFIPKPVEQTTPST